MKDELPVRQGGPAANFSRIKSFSAKEDSRAAVESLIDESKMFIAWTAPQAEINTAAMMADIQVLRVPWQLRWDRIWNDPVERKRIAENLELGQTKYWGYRGG